jgi:Ca2+/Na+ antiporter
VAGPTPIRAIELDDFDDVEKVEEMQSVGCHRSLVLVSQHTTTLINSVFNFIIPSLKPGSSSIWKCFFVLAICIIIIGYLTSTIVQLCQMLVQYIGMEESTVGATLIALGSEIPDTISSVSLARKGYNDGAMAGAIGSQVINISIGVGFPALIILFRGGVDSYVIDSRQTDTLWLLTCLLFLVISSYVVVTLPVRKIICCQMTSETSITRNGGFLLLSVWTFSYMVFIYFNE